LALGISPVQQGLDRTLKPGETETCLRPKVKIDPVKLRDEMDLFMLNPVNVDSLRKMQERKKSAEARAKGIENEYVFSLDDPNYTDYFHTDMRLAGIENGSIVNLEVASSTYCVDMVDCIPTEPIWQERRDYLSQEIKKFVFSKGNSELEDTIPQENQVCKTFAFSSLANWS